MSWGVQNHQISTEKWTPKLKKSQSKKEACCEEAPEGILDGKMCDHVPRHHETDLVEGGRGMDKSIPDG